LQLLPHNRGDFARLLMTKGNHERRFTGPERLEVLLDGSFPQFYVISELFDDSMVLKFLPAILKAAGFEILDRRF
jgi:hypothetical protein